MNSTLNGIKRTVCGIGYKKNIKTTEPNGSRKPYSVWKNMLNRCYSKSNRMYRFYGGKGVVVSDDWHCYDNFRRDIENLEGYDEVLFYENKLELDKDLLYEGNKIYSKDTCQWVTREENMSVVKKAKFQPHLVTTRLVALSPDDEEYCIVNIPLFAEAYNLNKVAVYGTLYDYGAKTCHGWCFKRVLDFNNVNTISRDEFKQLRYGVVPIKYKVIDKLGNVQIIDSAKELSKIINRSISAINQRTRDGKIYRPDGYTITREQII